MYGTSKKWLDKCIQIYFSKGTERAVRICAMSDIAISVYHGRQINFSGRALGRHLTVEIFCWQTSPLKTFVTDILLTTTKKKKKKINDLHSEKLKHFCFVTVHICKKNLHTFTYACNYFLFLFNAMFCCIHIHIW